MNIETEAKNNYKPKHVTNRRFFDLKLSSAMTHNLKYFVQQELGYYNAIVEQLTARTKAFPEDILDIKDRDIKLLETSAQYGISVGKLIDTPHSEWPDAFKSYYSMIINSDGSCQLSDRQIEVMNIGTCPGHLPSSVRRNIVSEAFTYVSNQAAVLLAGKLTENLKMPLQMLQTHTLDTKRHLQLNRSAIDVSFNSDLNQSLIKTPYGKQELIIEGFDITPIQFNSIIIRSPYTGQQNPKWSIELRDGIKYLLNLTDTYPRKQRRNKDHNVDKLKISRISSNHNKY